MLAQGLLLNFDKNNFPRFLSDLLSPNMEGSISESNSDNKRNNDGNSNENKDGEESVRNVSPGSLLISWLEAHDTTHPNFKVKIIYYFHERYYYLSSSYFHFYHYFHFYFYLCLCHYFST